VTRNPQLQPGLVFGFWVTLGQGSFPVLLPTVGTEGRDLTIALAAASPHTLHVGLVWWTLGMLLATMYFCIVYWLFRGKVPTQLDGYGH
jgi:cytochrome d ubiquinol oxidase subunit II